MRIPDLVLIIEKKRISHQVDFNVSLSESDRKRKTGEIPGPWQGAEKAGEHEWHSY